MDQWLSSKVVVKLGGVGVGSATDDSQGFSGNDWTTPYSCDGVLRGRPTSGWPLTAVKFKACAIHWNLSEQRGGTS
jgi:hypothetical protein